MTISYATSRPVSASIDASVSCFVIRQVSAGGCMSGVITPKSRTDLEAEISRSMIHFEKEYMGRGPLETRTYLLEDMILVRLKGVLTPAERKLVSSNSPRSGYLLKQVRNELLSTCRPLLEALLQDILNVRVQSVHTDISTKTGERLIVFTLQEKLTFNG
jgi:uncharacterized protein YbcI